MKECQPHECYYANTSNFLDDVLEYFQENHDERAKDLQTIIKRLRLAVQQRTRI